MDNRLISIVVPTYNSEQYVEECIKSICNQTYKNIEIIIVNDGSTDNTINIIEKLKQEDKRITIINQENSGAPVARNNGINYSNGKYIMFFDSDDVLKENALEIMINEIIKENVDLVIGNLETDNLNNKHSFQNERVYIGNEIFECSSISPYPGTKLYDNEIIKKNKIKFANVRIGQDLNFFFKYLIYSKKVKTISDIVAKYRTVSTGISKTYSYNILDIVNSFKNVKNEYIKNNKMLQYNNYISIMEVIHYGFQMNKMRFFKQKVDRKIIVLYFNNQIKNIKIEWNEYSNKFKKVYYKIKLKILFRAIYISNMYCKRRK